MLLFNEHEYIRLVNKQNSPVKVTSPLPRNKDRDSRERRASTEKYKKPSSRHNDSTERLSKYNKSLNSTQITPYSNKGGSIGNGYDKYLGNTAPRNLQYEPVFSKTTPMKTPEKKRNKTPKKNKGGDDNQRVKISVNVKSDIHEIRDIL